jgi:hypothetical protein
MASFSSTNQETDYNDSTKVFLESINATIKGVAHANYLEEHQNLSPEEKKKLKRFLIYRFDPQVHIFLVILLKDP